jgi:diguanylate cyclase (GGDEF)-like protein
VITTLTPKRLDSLGRKLDAHVPQIRSALMKALQEARVGPGRGRSRDLRGLAEQVWARFPDSLPANAGPRLTWLTAHLLEFCRGLADAQTDFESLVALLRALNDVVRTALPSWYGAREEKGMLSAWEELCLQALSALASTFLQSRDQVIREKNAESSVLFHTTQSITTEPDLQTLLYKVVFHASMLLHAKQLFLFLAETVPRDVNQPRRLQLEAWNPGGLHEGEFSLRFGEGPVGQAAETREPVLMNDYDQVEKRLPFLSAAARILAVPILFSDEVLGVLLAADHRRRARFTAQDQELLMMFATQIAVTLKNVLLFQEQTRISRELEEKNHMLEAQADEILRKSAQLVVMNEISQQVNSSLDLPAVLAQLARDTAESIGVDRCLVWLLDEQKIHLNAVAGYGVPPEEVGRLSVFLPDIRTSRFFQALAGQEAVLVGSGQDEVIFRDQLQGVMTVRSMLAVPLLLKKQTIGLLAVDDTREVHEFLEDEKSLISAIANQAVLAIENARLYEQVKEQAITDGLTGLYNHRYFQLRFSEAFAHSKRYGNDLSLIMLDIDHFKRYNDTYGHMAGDLALKEIANLTRASVRENDLVARYGGEEFVIILPMTPLAGAKIVAERIRESVQTCKFLGDISAPQVCMTVSLGLSAYAERHENRDQLLREADDALYEAKEGGRDRVVIFTPEAPPEGVETAPG